MKLAKASRRASGSASLTALAFAIRSKRRWRSRPISYPAMNDKVYARTPYTSSATSNAAGHVYTEQGGVRSVLATTSAAQRQP